MAKEYDNTNSGVLFRNKKRMKETQPNYTGSINIEGAEYWLSAWLKETKDGERFMSLAVNIKDKPKELDPNHPVFNSDDDIPL